MRDHVRSEMCRLRVPYETGRPLLIRSDQIRICIALTSMRNLYVRDGNLSGGRAVENDGTGVQIGSALTIAVADKESIHVRCAVVSIRTEQPQP
jgi:hypothetical protein